MTDAPPSPDAPALDRWRRAVIAGFAVGGVSVTAWGPRLPSLTVTFGLSTGAVGLLLAGVTLGAVVGLVAATPLLHHLGGRRAVGAAVITVGGGLVGLGVATAVTSLAVLAVAFVVVGLGIGTLDVLVNVEGSANERASGRTLLPRMHAAWSIGAAAGAALGAVCAALGVPPSTQFVAEGLAVAATAVVIMPSLPEVLSDDPAGAPTDAGTPVPTGWGPAVRRWLAAWRDRRLLVIGLVMLGCEIGEGSASTWLTLGAHRGHGLSAPVAAAFFAVFATSEALARLFGGPAVDRLGRVTTVRITTGLGVAGLVLFIVGRGTWWPLVGVVLWAVGVSMGFPLGMSAAAEGGPNPALRVSVVAVVGYAANLAGPPIIGSLAQIGGLLGALWVVAGGLAVAGLLAGALHPDGPIGPTPTSPPAPA